MGKTEEPPGDDRIAAITGAVIDSISFAKERRDGEGLSDKELGKAKEQARSFMAAEVRRYGSASHDGRDVR